MKQKSSADESATLRQKELIRAYGWRVPANCTKKQASSMINAANYKGLKVTKEYSIKQESRRAKEDEKKRKEDEKERIENEKIRRQHEADIEKDIADWNKSERIREPKGCLAAMFGIF